MQTIDGSTQSSPSPAFSHTSSSSAPPSPKSTTSSEDDLKRSYAPLPPILIAPAPANNRKPDAVLIRKPDLSAGLEMFAAVAASAPPLPLPAPKPPDANILNGADLNEISKLIKQRLAQYQRQGVIPGPQVSPQKRSVHNMCERRRRDNIRKGFAMLQRKLGELEGSGTGEEPVLSKMETLRKSIEVVGRVKEETIVLENEVHLLKQIKEQLVLKRRPSTLLPSTLPPSNLPPPDQHPDQQP